MKKKTMIALLTLFVLIISPLWCVIIASAQDVPYFTNEDLERYSNPGGIRDEESANMQEKTLRSKGGGDAAKNRFTVPYKAFEGNTRRIIIPVTINGRYSALMALDTGAADVIIFERLAKRMGILQKDEGHVLWQAAGIGGTTPAILTILDSVSVKDATEEMVPVIITKDLSNEFDGLLGMNFMAHYSIFIDNRKRQLIFEENKESLKLPGGHDEHWWRTNFQRFSTLRRTWADYLDYLNNIESDDKNLTRLKEFAHKQLTESERL
ncbi:MAG: clan AA aspartic protease, partial [Nitrospirae bacterium]|nr:clan AA aspartic protease [Nitrospirota bacterium]